MIGNNEKLFGDVFDKEMVFELREQRKQDSDDLEKELNLYRSGSAPPTVDGSRSAVGGLFNHGAGASAPAFADFTESSGNGFMSEEELRSDPAYLSYYHSNVNLNPRLPPPLISREDWRFAQRFQGGSSAIGDRRKVNRDDSGNGMRSMFPSPHSVNSNKHECEDMDRLQGHVEWGGDGLIGLPGLGLGSKQKSLVEIFKVSILVHCSFWPCWPFFLKSDVSFFTILGLWYWDFPAFLCYGCRFLNVVMIQMQLWPSL